MIFACVVVVLFVSVLYVRFLLTNPARKLDKNASMTYDRLEQILRIYPDRKFFGKQTYEEGWFVRLREEYAREAASYRMNAEHLSGSSEGQMLAILAEGRDTVFIDTYFYIDLIKTLYVSTGETHFDGEDQTLRHACLLDLRSRFAAHRSSNPVDPILLEYFGAEYVDMITGTSA